MLLFHVHVFVKSLMAICFICIMAWLFTALVTGLTKDCLHAQRSRIVIVNKVLTPFTWSFFCCFGIFLLKSLYTNFVTLRLLLVIVTVSLLVCLVFLPKGNQSRLSCTIQKYFGDENMSKLQKLICFFSLRKVIPFLRLRSGLSSHVTENCKWRAWLSR